MAQSKSIKRIFNMAYGIGAAVVILGALFKLTHMTFGPLNGTNMLIAGLLTEALIFFISAFEPVEDDLDWTLVYPELGGGAAKDRKVAAIAQQDTASDVSLSKKLDDMLKEAKIDGQLMESLGHSIRNFEGAAKNIAPTVDSIASTTKYSEELVKAASQMEALNNIYKSQLESAGKQAAINEEVAANAGKLKEEMKSLTSNLGSLNGVYGGMLSAMNRN